MPEKPTTQCMGTAHLGPGVWTCPKEATYTVVVVGNLGVRLCDHHMRYAALYGDIAPESPSDLFSVIRRAGVPTTTTRVDDIFGTREEAILLARMHAEEHAERLGVKTEETVHGARLTTNNGTEVSYGTIGSAWLRTNRQGVLEASCV